MIRPPEIVLNGIEVISRSIFRSLACALLFCVVPQSLWAQDVADCTESLDNAQTAYFNGEFDRVITLIQPCLDSENYTIVQGVQAFSLLGRTQFVLGETADATTAIEGLYKLDPTYEPAPQLPPDFRSFMLSVKESMIAEGSFPTLEPEVEEIETPEPPVVTEVIPEEEEVTKEKQPRKRRALLFGGGAALAVAAGAAILLSGGGSGGDPPPTSTDWPLPPAHP